MAGKILKLKCLCVFDSKKLQIQRKISFCFLLPFHLCGRTDRQTNKQTNFRLYCVAKTSRSATYRLPHGNQLVNFKCYVMDLKKRFAVQNFGVCFYHQIVGISHLFFSSSDGSIQDKTLKTEACKLRAKLRLSFS